MWDRSHDLSQAKKKWQSCYMLAKFSKFTKWQLFSLKMVQWFSDSVIFYFFWKIGPQDLPVIQVNHVSLLKHPSSFFGTIQISGTIGHCPPTIGKNEHSLNGVTETGVSELLPVFLYGRTNPGNVP